MKHTLKKTSPTRATIIITLDSKDLAEVRPLTISKLSRNLKVAGFRVGKVPAHVAEKNLDPSVFESQLIEDAVNKHVVTVLTDEKLQALDRPKVEVDSFEPKEKLVFTVEIEILPEIKLGNYKKLKAQKPNISVAEKDITEVIDRMRTGFSEKKEVERAAKDGDEAWINFEGRDEKGELVPGATGNDYPLVLGSGTFIPGFEEGIISHKPGDEFDVPLTFPKDYHAEALKNAKVIFKTKLTAVKEVSLPKVDDEFAKKCGPFKTVAELKADIKRELHAQKEREATNKLKDLLVEQLVAVSDVPVPDVLIEDQMTQIEQDTVQNLTYRGQTLEAYLETENKTHDQWRESELKPAAIRRVQVGLSLAELSKVENIDVTQEELNAHHSERLKQYTDPKVQAQMDSPEARRDAANRLMTEKTVDRLVELNTKK